MHLHNLGHQVMAVDSTEERVNAVLPYVTEAQIGDSTNESFLSSLGIRNFDACIVAIGDNFQSSLETTSLLKELGAKPVSYTHLQMPPASAHGTRTPPYPLIRTGSGISGSGYQGPCCLLYTSRSISGNVSYR